MERRLNLPPFRFCAPHRMRIYRQGGSPAAHIPHRTTRLPKAMSSHRRGCRLWWR